MKIHQSFTTKLASITLALLLVSSDLIAFSYRQKAVSRAFENQVEAAFEQQFLKDKQARLKKLTQSENLGFGLAQKETEVKLEEEKTDSSSPRILEKSSFTDLASKGVFIPDYIENVTRGALSYFFKGDYDVVSIPVELKKLPAGKSIMDVQVFVFDSLKSQWLSVPSEVGTGGEGDPNKGPTLNAAYQGGSDYFAGVIKTPEMPTANAFVPTTLSDIKAANPSEGMTIIQPPKQSQDGTANISYPFAIPSGRNGMQPNLALQYNSDGASSWVGYGWSLQIPSISIDTRWGAPLFTSTLETELYNYQGEELIGEDDYVPHRPSYYDANNKANQKPRILDSTEYVQRVSGGFKRIVRKGSTPDTYFWVVTDAQGNKEFYGTLDGKTLDTNSILLDRYGNCANWYLAKQVDKWGNAIEYKYSYLSYANEANPFVKGGYNKHLSEIEYTKHQSQSGYYKIKFLTRSGVRNDATTSFKLGGHIVDGAELIKIEVYANNSKIREWNLNYADGEFEKRLLTSIEEVRNGAPFYSHDFEYETMSQVNPEAEPDVISIDKFTLDDMMPNLGTNPSQELKEKIGRKSPLGSNSTWRAGLGGRVGINLRLKKPLIVADKNIDLNVGLSGGRSWSKNLTTFTDVDGDGLLDIIVKEGGQFRYYTGNRSLSGIYSISSTSKLLKASNIFQSTGDHLSTGIELVVPPLNGQLDYTWTWGKTKTYTTDYNSDGIIDIVSEDPDDKEVSLVYFGKINSVGDVEFSSSSEFTPNPVLKGESVSQLEDVPLDSIGIDREIVHYWVAPLSGVVDLRGDVGLGSSLKLRMAIQKQNQLVKPFENYNVSNDSFYVNNLSLNEGDSLFFRFRASDKGLSEFSWNPIIEYQNPVYDFNDPEGKPNNRFEYKNDFAISALGGVSLIDSGGSYTVSWPDFPINDPTDDVEFDVELIQYLETQSGSPNSVVISNLFSQKVNNGTNAIISTTPISINTIDWNKKAALRFTAKSNSNINWGSIKWHPTVESSFGNKSYPVPDLKVFNTTQKASFPYPTLGPSSGMQWVIQPSLNPADFSALIINGNEEYYANFIVKTKGALIGKGRVLLNSNGITYSDLENNPKTLFSAGVNGTWPVLLNSGGLVNDTLFIEFFTNDIRFGEKLSVFGKAEIFELGASSNTLIQGNLTTVGVHSHTENQLHGLGYRGWRQFAYIDTSSVLLDNKSINFNIPASAASWDTVRDPSTFDVKNIGNDPMADPVKGLKIEPMFPIWHHFQLINPGEQTESNIPIDRWQYYGGDIYFNDDTAKVTFVFEYPDSAAPSLLKVASDYSAFGVIKKSKSKSFNWGVGGEVKLPGLASKSTLGYNVGISGNFPNHDKRFNEDLTMFMDVNGDGYQDVIKRKEKANVFTIQYTNPFGGHRNEKTVTMSRLTKTSTAVVGVNVSGSLTKPLPSSGNNSKGRDITEEAGASKNQNLVNNGSSDNSSGNEFAKSLVDVLSVNNSNNWNYVFSKWEDVNGDGLIDQVYKGNLDKVYVRWNYGNSFSNSVVEITDSYSEELGESYGNTTAFSYGKKYNASKTQSWSAGIGTSITLSNNEQYWVDINNDGLSDLIEYDTTSSNPKIFLHTGKELKQLSSSNFNFPHQKESSWGTNVSANAKVSFEGLVMTIFGVDIDWFFNIAPTGGYSLEKANHGFFDVNGDGYIDYVKAKTGINSDLEVYYNNSGLANKLKRVINPIRGSFTLNYSLLGNRVGLKNSIIEDVDTTGQQQTYWDMRNSKYVLSQVGIYDGYDLKNGTTDLDGVDSVWVRYLYDGGYFSRREKKFIGFTRTLSVNPKEETGVLTLYHAPDNAGTIHNRQFSYKKGLAKASHHVLLDTTAQPSDLGKNMEAYLSTYSTYEFKQVSTLASSFGERETNSIHLDTVSENFAIAPELTEIKQKVDYQINAISIHEKRYDFDYDEYGNVITYRDFGNDNTLGTSDDVKSEITYFTPTQTNGQTGIPSSHEVFVGSSGTTLVRKTEVDSLVNNHTVGTIKSYSTASVFGRSTLKYDIYGNVKKMYAPKNNNGQRTFTKVDYDATINSYPIKVSNVHGDEVEMTYDFDYGQLLTTIDPNGYQIRYVYDSLDRASKIYGPEAPTALNSHWAIRFQYMPYGASEQSLVSEEKVPVAITYHYQAEFNNNSSSRDPLESLPINQSVENYAYDWDDFSWIKDSPISNKNTLQTATFIDGLGRVMQIKKDINQWQNNQWTERRTVSAIPKFNERGQVPVGYISLSEEMSDPLHYINMDIPTISQSQILFDQLGRPTETKTKNDAGNWVTTTVNYNWTNHQGMDVYSVGSIDPDGKASSVYFNANGQKVAQNTSPDGPTIATTNFVYDAIGQLVETKDPLNKSTTYQFDMFGRMTFKDQPNAGTTQMTYDKASNLVSMANQNLLSVGSTVQYKYDYDRLRKIVYPDFGPINNVHVKYGYAGDGINGAGRIVRKVIGEPSDSVLIDQMAYDNLGNVISQTRTIDVPTKGYYSFTTDFEYDEWGRIRSMDYPDGEVLKYHYGYGGDLAHFYGQQTPQSTKERYIQNQGFDEFGQRIHMVFGNNTETTFGYNINNHHLTTHTLKDGTASTNQLLDKSFVYSDAGNITSILNSATGVNYGYSVFGGQYQNNYTYDLMNRLSTVSGTLQGADGNLDQTTLSMSYDLVGSITNKNQLHQRNGMDVGNTYNYNYLKNNTAQPHTITEIQDPNINIQMNYDANGNMTREEGIAPGGSPAQSYLNMFLWDENNRLIAENNAGGFHHFLYDSDGTRYLKGSIWTGTAGVNGQNIGQSFMQGDYTVYVSPYVVVNLSQTKDPVYSKHYYQGQERIASRVGSWPSNLSNPNSGESVQAHPLWGPVETGTSEWDAEVDRGFLNPDPQTPFESELVYGDANGCMDFYQNDPLEAERCVCENYPEQAASVGVNCEIDALYYYHSDYLGNVEYITDKNGRAYQYFWYSAWGEVLKEDHAHTGNFDNPFRFNGKEVDPETGLHYYGSRYYDSKKSVWLGVDPKAHWYPNKTSFGFSGNNPIMIVDPNGKWEQDANGNWVAQKGDSWWKFHKQTGLSWKETIAFAKKYNANRGEKNWKAVYTGDVVGEGANKEDRPKVPSTNNNMVEKTLNHNPKPLLGSTQSIEASRDIYNKTGILGDKINVSTTMTSTNGATGTIGDVNKTFTDKGELSSLSLSVGVLSGDLDVQNIGFGVSISEPASMVSLRGGLSINDGLSLGYSSPTPGGASGGSVSYRPGGGAVLFIGVAVFLVYSGAGAAPLLIPALGL